MSKNKMFKIQCSEEIYHKVRGRYRCSREAVAKWKGKYYCWQHDPVRIAEKRAEENAARQAEMKRKQELFEKKCAHEEKIEQRMNRLNVSTLEELLDVAERMKKEIDDYIMMAR